MNEHAITPTNFEDLKQLVESHDLLLAIGNRTKPALSETSEATWVSLREIRGMIQYEPSEFTFTAWAGTPVSEIDDVLAARNQYLPFDPMLLEAGATLGGTVASGLSGPGRQRYGGIRDFLLGVQFLSGDGNVINAGGKVVKNAAGFDIPKLMVGSLGRLGLMTQLTFKVFPRPIAARTVLVQCASHEQAIERIASAASSRWELDAINYRPNQQAMFLRIAGPETANEEIAAEVRVVWGDDVVDAVSPNEFWRGVRELTWFRDSPTMVWVPTTGGKFLELIDQSAEDREVHYHLSAAANVLWVGCDSKGACLRLMNRLVPLGIYGLVLRGGMKRPLLGSRAETEMETAVKHAMDPSGRFPTLPAAAS